MAHIFISHSRQDDGIVRQIREALEGRGVPVWADSWRLAPGDILPSEIERAIEGAEHFIAVLSVNAVNSAWVPKEIKYALEVQKKRGPSYRVIPILLPDIKPAALGLWFEEELLAVMIRVGPGGITEALPALLEALGKRLPMDGEPTVQAPAQPLADLVLKLTDPAIDQSEGKRRATAEATLTYMPPDGAPAVESTRYRITAPLGPIEAEDLRWYLERYWRWPTGVFRQRAERVEEQLPEWGRLLYEAFANDAARNALEAWKAAGTQGERRFTVLVDHDLAAGSAGDKQIQANEAAAMFLALPWELIRDDEGFLFHGAHPVRVRRRLPKRKSLKAVVTEPPIRVLLASPRPEDEQCGFIDHRASARPLVEALSRLGDLAQFKVLAPPTFQALEDELQRAADSGRPYHVVHFDGHGIYSREHALGVLCFEDPADSAKLEGRKHEEVTAERLAEVIRGHRVPLFFLDACQTAVAKEDPTASVAGRLLQSGVASVVAMSHSVLVETARRFVAAFYRELMSGRRVGWAMLAGQRALSGDSFRGKVFSGELRLQDWFVPVLFQEERDLQLLTEVPGEQVQAIMEEQRELALGELPPAPAHSFVGRSRELLAAERLLGDNQRYIVLLGEAGEGKTTLGCELARWLVATRRFKRAAFVSLEREDDARKALFSLGRQLVAGFVSQAGADVERALLLVERALREQPTVIVLDNMESVLPPAAGSEAASAFEPEVLEKLFELCGKLEKLGGTRLVFTSREVFPEPFERNRLRIGRLEPADAIELVAGVLGKGNLMPHAQDQGESEEEIKKLVEAVGCHARSLVLVAREVADGGVRNATERIQELMARMHARHPGDRERSLYASVELSLRRLPAATRQKIRPLGVFQGGGSVGAIGMALGLERGEAVQMAKQLVGVGLVDMLPYGYLRFDPALCPALLGELNEEQKESARAAWAQAMRALAGFLYQTQSSNPALAQNLTLLELPNLLAGLECFSRTAAPEETVDFATAIEGLLTQLGRPKAMARAAKIRTEAAGRLGEWSHARFQADEAQVERLLEAGRHGEAVAAARGLLDRAQVAGEKAYEGAACDLALAHLLLGRALSRSGRPEEALLPLEVAREKFQMLAAAGDKDAARMASVALTDKADCLRALGHLDEAADAYEEATQAAEARSDPRSVATNQGQLATVRMDQRRYQEALDGHREARDIFESLGELGSVATAWHNIGRVHREAGQYDLVEEALQEALRIRVQTGDRGGEGDTLNELGNLYVSTGRHEDAVRFYRQAADVFGELRDLQNEGRARNNAAAALLELGGYDEARQELERAIRCKEPFGHAALPWTTFALLHDLEVATGNAAAAAPARHRAIEAYLAYRRAGGESQTPGGELSVAVAEAVHSGQTGSAAGQLSAPLQRPDLPAYLTALIPALQAILAGSRERALAEDPALDYDDAAELLLLLESLS